MRSDDGDSGSSGSPRQTWLKLAAVSHNYRKRTALRALSVTVGTGITGVLGPNGAGKTTLMRVLATLLPLQQGTADLQGDNYSDRRSVMKIRGKLGYLPQDFEGYPGFTVREFVEYFALLKQMPRRELASSVERALEFTNLIDRADDRIGTLSGGMRRRLGIAQAIVNRPALLLLDEPTAGLDPEERLRFRRMLSNLGGDRVVIMSTHLVEDVAAVCENLLVLNHGSLLFGGTPDSFLASAKDRVWMMANSGDLPPHIVAVPAGEATVRYVGERFSSESWAVEPTLEDAYTLLMSQS